MPEDSVQVVTPTDTNIVSDTTADNARLVEDAANRAVSAQSDTVSKGLQDVQNTISDGDAKTSAQLDGIAATLDSESQTLDAMLVKLGESNQSETNNQTVVIDSGQWSEMRESWLWAKSCAGVGLFLALVGVLMVSAIFGNKLWTAFSKGWRK